MQGYRSPFVRGYTLSIFARMPPFTHVGDCAKRGIYTKDEQDMIRHTFTCHGRRTRSGGPWSRAQQQPPQPCCLLWRGGFVLPTCPVGIAVYLVKRALPSTCRTLLHVFGQEPQHETAVFLQQCVLASFAAAGFSLANLLDLAEHFVGIPGGSAATIGAKV